MNLLNSINWGSFGIVLAILAVLAIIFTILILVINKFCTVEEDPKIGMVASNLSGANCGGCGFAGCADFAKALVEGRAQIGSCSATASENKQIIAQILGQTVEDNEPMISVIMCAGNNEATKKRLNYIGNDSCEAISMTVGNDKVCSYGCIGGGTCVSHCAFSGISVNDGVAINTPSTCTGCGVCVKKCPKKVIGLIPKSAKVYVACSSKSKGKEVMDACKVGCIACGLCMKNCPENAITMVDNLPVIDYSKCSGCKTCVIKCPRKTIKEL